ncbi:MAG: ribosome-associated translation inhibitor RaiA [Fimbriimonadaceae bacterium]
MQVIVRNTQGQLTERDREYAVKKLEKLSRYFHSANSVEIVYREEKSFHRLDVTVHADGYHLRGDEEDESVRAAVDAVVDKLERRLRRLRTRIIQSHRKRGENVPLGLQEVEHHEEDPHEVNETKSYLIKPMSVDEAALQMELLGRDFFVFIDEHTAKAEVIYRRSAGPGYGLLVPEGTR